MEKVLKKKSEKSPEKLRENFVKSLQEISGICRNDCEQLADILEKDFPNSFQHFSLKSMNSSQNYSRKFPEKSLKNFLKFCREPADNLPSTSNKKLELLSRKDPEENE